MTKYRKFAYALPLSLLLAGVCAFAQSTTEAAGMAASAKSIALTPGVCATVKEGDIVAFEWNPGFEHPAEVGDLMTFRLTFGKIEDDGTIRRVGDRVTLSTLPVRGQRSLGEGSLSAPINGIYQMNFPVYLHGVPSGEYDLINTKAETSTEQGISDSTSAMTNSPLRYRFCLNVIASAPVGRK